MKPGPQPNAVVGERNPHAKVTEEWVREIRERYAAGGVTQEKLAVEYGITRSAVSRIVTGSNWGHLGMEC